MESTGDVTIRTRLLRWVINAILVLSVISFSGHVSAPKSFSDEATRTELKETRWTACKRTLQFTNFHDVGGHPEFFDQPENFSSGLFQYGRQIEVNLKDNPGKDTVDDKQFLIHFFNYNPEESLTGAPRG